MSKTKAVLDVREWERRIGEGAESWKGRCYDIATRGVACGLVPGVAVYGHYLGAVHADSMFAPKAWVGFQRHGWVRAAGGVLYDPTRWVFEAVDPYVFTGKADACREYDEGGCGVRQQFRQPPPKMVSGYAKNWDVVMRPDLSPNDTALLGCLIGDGEGFTRARLYWLANHGPEELGEACKPFYRWLRENKMQSAVPADNWRRVMASRGTRFGR
jgi:hypothetical protein